MGLAYKSFFANFIILCKLPEEGESGEALLKTTGYRDWSVLALMLFFPHFFFPNYFSTSKFLEIVHNSGKHLHLQSLGQERLAGRHQLKLPPLTQMWNQSLQSLWRGLRNHKGNCEISSKTGLLLYLQMHSYWLYEYHKLHVFSWHSTATNMCWASLKLPLVTHCNTSNLLLFLQIMAIDCL